MNSKIVTITVLFFVQLNAFSQEIKMKVLDSESLNPIAYAHIFDGINGTLTNADGEFIIDKKNTLKKITISHTGYDSKEILINDINPKQPINLNPKAIELNEVVVYSMDDLFANIKKGLKVNYMDSDLDELMFFRVILMKNNDEGQLSEGYIQVLRDKYFDISKDRRLDIQLISNKKVNNLKNIDYQYYSFEKLLQLSESFQKLTNGNYNFNYIKIDDDFMKIEYLPKPEIAPHERTYKGYLLIDSKSYAILEFQYSVSSTYMEQLTPEKIGSNLLKRDVSASKFVKWVKDVDTGKYKLSFLKIKDELMVEDSKSKTEDKYIATYEIHNIGKTGNLELTKKQKTSSKKNVFEYSNLNLDKDIWKNHQPILRNKEQDSMLNNFR